MNGNNAIASILVYPEKLIAPNRLVQIQSNQFYPSKGTIGIIGSGNFTSAMILPCLKKTSGKLKIISSASGLSGTTLAKKYKIPFSTTDNITIMEDRDIDLVMITTRHNSHAKLVIEALKADKNVFVEKPLALNAEELDLVIEAYKNSGKTVTVGFNRRFAPLSIKMKTALGNANSSMNIIATMNAGFIPSKVWVQDMQIGGGRIIGEACHFIDLITYLTGSRVVSVCMNAMGENPNENTDTATIMLKYENGSTGVINYFSNGSKSYPKERIEIYSQERTAVIDNFRITTGFGFNNFKKLKTSLDKGHKEQFQLLINQVINGGNPLIPFDEIVNTTKASFAAISSLKNGSWVSIK
jgi:predicted dehydrogenase